MNLKLNKLPPPNEIVKIPGYRSISLLPQTYTWRKRVVCWIVWRAPLVRYIARFLVGVSCSPYRQIVVDIDPKKQQRAMDYLEGVDSAEADDKNPDIREKLSI